MAGPPSTTTLNSRVELAQAAFKAWIKTAPPHLVFPSLDAVRRVPSIEQAINSDEDTTLKPAFFDALVSEHMPEFMRSWRSANDAFLHNLLPQSYGHQSKSPLDLATTWFSYKDTSAPRDYPAIMNEGTVGHCLNSHVVFIREGNETVHLSFDKKASAIAARLAWLSHLDPATATSDQMDQLNMKFVFATEVEENEEWMVYNWRGMIGKLATLGSGVSQKLKSVAALNKKASAAAINQLVEALYEGEQAVSVLFDHLAPPIVGCAYCRFVETKEQSGNVLMDHLVNVHKRGFISDEDLWFDINQRNVMQFKMIFPPQWDFIESYSHLTDKELKRRRFLDKFHMDPKYFQEELWVNDTPDASPTTVYMDL